jgi:hypothetical protein
MDDYIEKIMDTFAENYTGGLCPVCQKYFEITPEGVNTSCDCFKAPVLAYTAVSCGGGYPTLVEKEV